MDTKHFPILPSAFVVANLSWQPPQGSFELVLGISSQDLDLNSIDSITVDYVYGTNQALRRPSEVHRNCSFFSEGGYFVCVP